MSNSLGQPTLGDLIAEIADDLDRPDLEPQIRRAIAAAVRRFQPERFTFNEQYVAFQTILGADIYGRGDEQEIPEFYAIDSVVLVEEGDVHPLARVAETWIEAAGRQSDTSYPCAYSYFDRSIRLWPVPSAAWTVRIAAHVRIDMPTDDAAPCPWFDEGRDLIAARAKWHLALHVLKDASLATAMQIATDEARATLRGSANVIASTGQIQAWDH